MALISAAIWESLRVRINENRLNSPQVVDILRREYDIYISRQAIYDRMKRDDKIIRT